MNILKKEKKSKQEKTIETIKKQREKKYNKYKHKHMMKQRIKNSQSISNVKEIDNKGLIYLKTGEVASLL